jgi:hypothetical protein
LKEWEKLFEQLDLKIETELDSMKIYPPLMNFLFGGRVQFMAVLRNNGVRSHRVETLRRHP